MARNTLRLDFTGFEGILTELDAVGGDVVSVTDRALREAAVTIQNQTVLALNKKYLPAKGAYSLGLTQASVIHFPRVEWEGMIGWVPVGFDYSKAGAGGYLITGTPNMAPDAALRKIFKGGRFMSRVQRAMLEHVWNELLKKVEENR